MQHGCTALGGRVAAVARRPRSNPGIAVSGFPEASPLTGVGAGTRSVGPEHWGGFRAVPEDRGGYSSLFVSACVSVSVENNNSSRAYWSILSLSVRVSCVCATQECANPHRPEVWVTFGFVQVCPFHIRMRGLVSEQTFGSLGNFRTNVRFVFVRVRPIGSVTPVRHVDVPGKLAHERALADDIMPCADRARADVSSERNDVPPSPVAGPSPAAHPPSRFTDLISPLSTSLEMWRQQ